MKILDFETQISVNGFANVDGTKVSVIGMQDVTEEEARAYVEDVRKRYPQEAIASLEISNAEGWQRGNFLHSKAPSIPAYQKDNRLPCRDTRRVQ